tara:strand:- start:528 stop:1130 length:603 start_codon:yes stop_codon:yes gene_type:complete
MKVELELSMNKELIKHSIRNGILCGLWAMIPGLIILANSEDGSLISLAADFLMLIILFPAIICITCVVLSASYIKTSEIIMACLICSFVSIIWLNVIIQVYILIYSALNDLVIELEFGAIFDIKQILIAMFAGLFSAIIRIANPISSDGALIEAEQLSNLPAKPDWDPRIEKLKGELHQTNSNLQSLGAELRKEIWQMRK